MDQWRAASNLELSNPLIQRQRLLDDLAGFLLQLWTTSAPPALSPAKNLQYSVWLTESLDRGLRRTLTGTARWGNASNYLITERETFAEDRLFLENSTKKKELSQNLPVKVSRLLRDSGQRLIFQSAFHFKGIHQKFVEMHCPRTEENIQAARLQLDTVLNLYPELEGMQGVHRVKDILVGNRKDVYSDTVAQE